MHKDSPSCREHEPKRQKQIEFYEFGDFRLYPGDLSLLHQETPVKLPPMEHRLLSILVEARGERVSLDSLIAQAVTQFSTWLEARGLREFNQVRPVVIAAFVEDLQKTRSGHRPSSSTWRPFACFSIGSSSGKSWRRIQRVPSEGRSMW